MHLKKKGAIMETNNHDSSKYDPYAEIRRYVDEQNDEDAAYKKNKEIDELNAKLNSPAAGESPSVDTGPKYDLAKVALSKDFDDDNSSAS